MTDPERTARIEAARRAVTDAGLTRRHVAHRLLQPDVSLTWDIACEAAYMMALMHEELRELRREALRSQQRELRRAMYEGEG